MNKRKMTRFLVNLAIVVSVVFLYGLVIVVFAQSADPANATIAANQKIDQLLKPLVSLWFVGGSVAFLVMILDS